MWPSEVKSVLSGKKGRVNEEGGRQFIDRSRLQPKKKVGDSTRRLSKST